MENVKYQKKKNKGGRPAGKTKQTKPVEFLSNKIYTANQAAEILQVNERTIHNMIKRGSLKGARTSAGLRIKGRWIDQALEQMIPKG